MLDRGQVLLTAVSNTCMTCTIAVVYSEKLLMLDRGQVLLTAVSSTCMTYTIVVCK